MQEQSNWLDSLAALRGTMGDVPADETSSDNCDNPPVKSEQNRCPRLDIILERKGRAGKSATIVSGFTLSDEAVSDLASRMKRALGTGGSARGGEILVQGDRRKDVLEFLTSNGYKARII
ncbi:MAG: translation initiation factor [Muribaculaceae bacterium]|nr:translation initiation factor [Muribaculaceae bacterium]